MPRPAASRPGSRHRRPRPRCSTWRRRSAASRSSCATTGAWTNSVPAHGRPWRPPNCGARWRPLLCRRATRKLPACSSTSRASASSRHCGPSYSSATASKSPRISCAHRAGALALLGVRAFMFQEGQDPAAERAFRQIASITGGAYSRFDSHSAAHLRDLLGAVAAYDRRRDGRPWSNTAETRRHRAAAHKPDASAVIQAPRPADARSSSPSCPLRSVAATAPQLLRQASRRLALCGWRRRPDLSRGNGAAWPSWSRSSAP